MSNFDPDVFLSTQASGVLDTVKVAVPPAEYTGVIEKIEARIQNSRDGQRQFLVLDLSWGLDDAKLKTAMSRDKIVVRQSLFIDRTEDGAIDMGKGKNVQLGKLREAINQNNPGPWAPSMMVGSVARVKVINEVDKGLIYDKVVAVAPL